jgi:hypothetical protein
MNIVVLEDTFTEQAARATEKEPDLTAKIVTTLAEAVEHFDTGDVDAAIIDIHVPLGYIEDPFTEKYRQRIIRAVKSRRDSRNLKCTLKEYVDPLRKAMKPEAKERPFGIVAAEVAEREDVPFVLATSKYHHDSGAVGKICVYQRFKGWPEMIDEMDKSGVNEWKSAVDELRS